MHRWALTTDLLKIGIEKGKYSTASFPGDPTVLCLVLRLVALRPHFTMGMPLSVTDVLSDIIGRIFNCILLRGRG